MPKEEAGAKRKQVDGDHPVTVSKKRAVETELKILDNKVEKKKSCRAPLEGESTSDDTEDDYVMVRPKRKQNKKAMKPHSITKSGQKIRTDTSKSGSSSGNSDGVSHLLPSTSLLKHPIESNNGETVSPPIPGVPANFNTVKCEVTERRAEVTKVKSIDSASLGWVAKMLVFFIGILLSALPFVRYCSNDALAAAALSGQPNLAKLMIIAGADVESRNVNGETLLLEACRLGNERAVQIYLNCGSLTEVLSKEGDTALQLALRMRKYKIANYLVEAGANVNAKNRNGESLLVQAIRLENYYISKFLISSGAAVNSKSMSGEEVLAMAFRTNQLETAKLLIQFGANVNSVTSDGVSVLGAAVLYDDSEKAKLLISAGADVEVVGKDGVTSPLMHAVMNGNKEIVTLLLAEGANTEVKNRGHWTPLLLSVDYNRIDILDLLLAAGANINAVTETDGKTGLMWAIVKGYEDIASRLIASGADVNLASKAGNNALTIANQYNRKRIERMLLKKPNVVPGMKRRAKHEVET